MKLSTKSRYALEGLFYMAIATLDRAASIKEIAAETKISPAYLEQIFFKLKQFGIIRTVRGARGGFLFEKPLSEITVGQIIRAVEGSLVPVKCVESLSACTSKVRGTCISRQVWVDLSDAIARVADSLTLEQLREMDGKPVWIVEYPDWGHWELSEDAEDYLCDRDTDLYGFMSDLDGEAGFHELGWLAYPYPPAHIDRSKWEACDHCKKACWNCNHNLFAVKEMTKCDDCVNQSKWEFLAYQNYCPKCGRPLTEEAWVELERRVMR